MRALIRDKIGVMLVAVTWKSDVCTDLLLAKTYGPLKNDGFSYGMSLHQLPLNQIV
jgi:hypothetical protein